MLKSNMSSVMYVTYFVYICFSVLIDMRLQTLSYPSGYR